MKSENKTVNLYYRTVLRRKNKLKALVFDLTMGISGYARLFLEVFIRKNFGERYFSLAGVMSITVFLGLVPWLEDRLSFVMHGMFTGMGYYNAQESSFWLRYTTWYFALAAFVYFSYLRWQEVRRNPSVFDFERFSLYTGDINPFFSSPPFLKSRPTVRMVEIIWEPLGFLALGILLKLFGQSVGTLLIISSILYAIGYSGAYYEGDNFVMDHIDQIILNKELEKNFVDGAPDESNGVLRLYFRPPTNPEDRESLMESMIVYDEKQTMLAF